MCVCVCVCVAYAYLSTHRQIMEDILFCYVREHEELGYRQGMHELLAPILFIMHAEMRDMDDPSLA